MVMKFNGAVKECRASGIGKVTYVAKAGTADKPQLKVLIACTCNKKPADGEKYSPSQTFGVTLFGKQATNAVEYSLLVTGNMISFSGEIEGVYVGKDDKPAVINLASYTFNYQVVARADDELEQLEDEEPSVEERLEAPPTKSKRTEELDLT